MKMDYLNWELSILSRAVAYKNLSSAVQHINISQPQLSRIIHKLEENFNVVLLDRDAKRKSSWTKAAFDLSNAYSKIFKQFQNEVNLLADESMPDHIAIGVLEGLSQIGMDLCHYCFEKHDFKTVELQIYDQDELEENFFKGELQMILSSRTIGKKKFKYVKHLGYQSLKIMKSSDPLKIMSPFEFHTNLHTEKDEKPRKQKKEYKVFVSNSLAVRRQWLETYGGTGFVPSQLYKQKKSEEHELEVMLIGDDQLSPKLWEVASQFMK